MSILHVLTLGYENTCKGTSKEHLTNKNCEPKVLDCCPKTAAKDSLEDKLTAKIRSKTDLFWQPHCSLDFFMVSEPLVARTC